MSDLRLSVLPPAGKDGGACGTRGVLPKHHASAFRSVATRRVPRRACAREHGQTWNLSSSEREPVRARFSAPHPVAKIPHSTASAKPRMPVEEAISGRSEGIKDVTKQCPGRPTSN